MPHFHDGVTAFALPTGTSQHSSVMVVHFRKSKIPHLAYSNIYKAFHFSLPTISSSPM
jgi:hypothetical protein